MTKHNGVYDAVVAARFDFLRPIMLDLHEIDCTKLYVNDVLRPRNLFPDQLVAGSPAIVASLLNAYSEVQNYLFSKHVVDKLNELGESPALGPELLLFASFISQGFTMDQVVFTSAIPSAFE